jgi:Ca-activated chloride channel family protein
VTALYEIVPVGVPFKSPGVDDLKYQQTRSTTEAADSGELLTVKLRYKAPDADVSNRLVMAVTDMGLPFENAGQEFKFASSVAAFGMLLRDSAFKGNADYDMVLQIARAGRGKDEHGYRAEFINLVQNAAAVSE